ncbi:glycosyltransferase family 61 protein [archaeon]|nr:MAG: glycosyltransferase family 61 protein [archaeon]
MMDCPCKVLLLLLLIWQFYSAVQSLRDRNEYPLVVDYSEHYNYHTLHEKMVESMSVNNCTLGGDYTYGESRQPDLMVKLVPPPQAVLAKWTAQEEGKVKARIFTHVSHNLCSARQYKDVVKGFFKRAKGCYKVYVMDNNGMRKKRFNDYGATLHPEHIRCDIEVAGKVCSQGSTGIQVIDNVYRTLGSYPFIVSAKKVLVSRGGMFALPCGPFGLFSSCEAVKWSLMSAASVVKDASLCRERPRDCPYPLYQRVFSMTQYDDTQIGQFMQENWPKLMYHLDFLRANPDVMIHFGFSKRPVLPSFVLPHNFFSWLGLQNRLINGTYYAEEVIMPREGGCQDIGYNAWEMVSMRDQVYGMLGIKEKPDFSWITPRKGSILILTRSPGAFTQNKADYMHRRWTKDQLSEMVDVLKASYPDKPIEVFADTNRTLMTCPLCQAQMFSEADLVIGYHGAGLSNMMFMKPGGVVVEVVYYYDSRHAPVVGIFPRISDIIGLNHLIYYVRDIELDINKMVEEIVDFQKKTHLWA